MSVWILWLACATQQEKPTEEFVEESHHCTDGSYAATFSVWSDRPDEENFTEEDPLCENTIDVYVEGDLIQTSFECTFQRGGQDRILEYEISGLHSDEANYAGDVWFTRGNGEVVQTSFNGTCAKGE
ncbi:MAG: hypothetical protein CL916_14020, partial [Deltaproteobacteria bacterium]|nr:hypothetical protein [Deltaproteobacteria bacterium]